MATKPQSDFTPLSRAIPNKVRLSRLDPRFPDSSRFVQIPISFLSADPYLPGRASRLCGTNQTTYSFSPINTVYASYEWSFAYTIKTSPLENRTSNVPSASHVNSLTWQPSTRTSLDSDSGNSKRGASRMVVLQRIENEQKNLAGSD